MKKILLLFLLLIPYSVNADNYFDNYIVMDINSKRIFDERASNIKKLPASTTKIMTAIVGLENSNLTDIVKVGDEILTVDGSNIYLEIGESILMQDLLYGMILRSGNDAAMAVAKHAGGNINNFVRLMNEKARSLGLYNTTFNNPTGLDDYEKNYSTAKDLAIIYSYAYKNKDFRRIIRTKVYKTFSSSKSYLFNNRSKILKMYDKCTGAKTGYTPDAGRLLVSSANDNGLDIVIVSIGNNYGYEKHIDMFEKVFKDYNNYLVIDKNNIKIKNNFNGKIYIKNNFYYPLNKDEVNLIKKKIVFNGKKTNHVGDIFVYLNGKNIHKEKLFLKKNNGNFFDKIFDIFS